MHLPTCCSVASTRSVTLLQAEKVTKHLQKGTTQAYADDEGGLHLANRFVWKKKIAKDIQEGATVKEVTAKVKSSGELDRQAVRCPFTLLAAALLAYPCTHPLEVMHLRDFQAPMYKHV